MGSTRAEGGHNKVSRPKQDGYEIVLNSQEDTVNQVWVRFGTLDDNGNHKWDRTMDMGPVKINKGEKKAVAVVDEDQLPTPADSCYYQLLCEIDDEHGHPEMLMTEPTLLQNNIAS